MSRGTNKGSDKGREVFMMRCEVMSYNWNSTVPYMRYSAYEVNKPNSCNKKCSRNKKSEISRSAIHAPLNAYTQRMYTHERTD